MKYRVVVKKIVEAVKTFEVDGGSLDAMHNPGDADFVRNLANVQAINDDFADAEKTETKFIIGGIEAVEENPYIDEYGHPYVEDKSMPAGGGLHKDCDYNAEALYAFNVLKDRRKIETYLAKRNFHREYRGDCMEIWYKGNTEVTFESYIDGMWGYLHTEPVVIG